MFHGHLDTTSQEELLGEYCKQDSIAQCVVSTVAFVMGVEVPNIRYVMHWGPPQSVLGYWQEVGRCARDGDKGQAIMYIPAYSLRPLMVDDSLMSIGLECFNLLRVKF